MRPESRKKDAQRQPVPCKKVQESACRVMGCQRKRQNANVPGKGVCDARNEWRKGNIILDENGLDMVQFPPKKMITDRQVFVKMVYCFLCNFCAQSYGRCS